MSSKKSIQNKKNMVVSGSKKQTQKSKTIATSIVNESSATPIAAVTAAVIATKGIETRVVEDDVLPKTATAPASGSVLTSDGCLTKPILKKKPKVTASKKKPELKQEKKKSVIFQLERNETQLFNKLNNVSEIKPGIPVAQAIKLTPPTPKPAETTVTNTQSPKPSTPSTPVNNEPVISTEQPVTNTNNSKKSKKASATQTPTPAPTPTPTPTPTQTPTPAVEEQSTKSKKGNKKQQQQQQQQEEKVLEEVSVVPEMKEKDVKKLKTSDNKTKEVVVAAAASVPEKVAEVKEVAKKDKKKERDVISGFSVLPVKIPQTSITKYIYYKKETSKKWPVNKTLFLTNLPHSCSSLLDLQVLLQSTDIESVQYGSVPAQADEQQVVPEPESTTVAHIIMKSAQSLADLLKYLNIIDIKLPTQSVDGFDEMLNEEQSKIVKDFDELQIKLDAAMMEHDKRMLEERHNRRDMQGVPDDDGFILVTGNNKTYKPISQEDLKKKEEDKKQKNFYSFQQRQQKKQELDNLRKKFEEDKQKIAKMSANRKFKPY